MDPRGTHCIYRMTKLHLKIVKPWKYSDVFYCQKKHYKSRDIDMEIAFCHQSIEQIQ